jgi:hypothetical protein
VQRGDVKLPRGEDSAAKQKSTMTRAMRTVDRKRASLSASAAAYQRPRERPKEGLAAGDPLAVEAALIEEGLSPEDARQTAADIAEMNRRGGPAGVAGDFEDEGFFGQIGQDISTGVLSNVLGPLWTSGREKRIERAQQMQERIQARTAAAAPAGQAAGSDPEVKALMQRIAENTGRAADNGVRPPVVNVNVGAGGAPVPQPGPGPRIR